MPALFDDDVVSCNDSQFSRLPKLPEATAVYQITHAKSATSKDKNELMVILRYKNTQGEAFEHMFMVGASQKDARRIAQSALKGHWDACGLQGAADLDMLPNFVNKFVKIEAYHSKPAADGSFFANFNRVDPATGFPGPTDDGDAIPMHHTSDREAAPTVTSTDSPPPQSNIPPATNGGGWRNRAPQSPNA